MHDHLTGGTSPLDPIEEFLPIDDFANHDGERVRTT
jgi:hypothetical protein